MADAKEDQNKKTEKTASTSGTQSTVVIDTEEMPHLVSSDEEEQPTKGAKNKHFVSEKPTTRKTRNQLLDCIFIISNSFLFWNVNHTS